MKRAIVVILSALVLVVSLVSCVSYEGFTYARSGNVESANDITSIEVAKPTGAASGDLLIGVVTTDGDTSGEFTGPTGWTPIDVGWSGNGSYGGGCTLGAWYLIAGDSEPGSYQWTWTTEETVYAFIIRITGHDMDNPIDAWSSDTGTDGFSATCPAVNTTVADTLVLRIFGYDSCCGWNANYPNEHIDITVESSRPGCESGAVGHCSGGAAYTAQETAGDTGTADFQVTQGEGLRAWRTLTIAVGPTPIQYGLTMAADPEEGGTATDLTDGSPYAEGTEVSIKAEANEGYEFVSWTATAGGFDNASAAETTFTMPAQNVTVTANFELVPTILVLLPESGTNSVDTTHDLRATVRDQFNNVMAGVDVTWGISGVGSFSDTPESQTDINGEADAVITSSEHGTSTVTCEVTGKSSVSDTATKGWTYTPEATTLELLPATGENPVDTTHDLRATVRDQFNNMMAGVDVTWGISGVGSFSDTPESQTDINGEADAVITSSEPGTSTVTCEVTGKPSVSDTATKDWTSVATYDLTMAADPAVGGTATDLTNGSPYAEGTKVSIKAEANEGYEFVNWTAPAGGFDDASAAETTFTMPAADVTVTANFELVSEVPMITTQAATEVRYLFSTVNMNYIVGNNYSQVEVRFAYKKSTDAEWSYTAWVSKTADGSHDKMLTGLDSDTDYDFKAQLKYDDIVNGETAIEGAILQFTTLPIEGCFIATAAYGTPTAEQIDVLREFRDAVLLESTVGSQFVSLYYQLSPPVAEFIAGNELLRTMVRELLVDPIVWVVEATGDIWQN